MGLGFFQVEKALADAGFELADGGKLADFPFTFTDNHALCQSCLSELPRCGHDRCAERDPDLQEVLFYYDIEPFDGDMKGQRMLWMRLFSFIIGSDVVGKDGTVNQLIEYKIQNWLTELEIEEHQQGLNELLK